MYNPPTLNFTTPIIIQNRTETTVNGAPKVIYVDADPALDYCSWKGRGGTETTEAGTLKVIDTAEVTMWYRPDISEKSRILLEGGFGPAYDVMNIEDVEQRHTYLILKVKRAVNA